MKTRRWSGYALLVWGILIGFAWAFGARDYDAPDCSARIREGRPALVISSFRENHASPRLDSLVSFHDFLMSAQILDAMDGVITVEITGTISPAELAANQAEVLKQLHA